MIGLNSKRSKHVTKETKFPVIELFGPTIQGEGLMTGTVTHFLRTGGCGLRCSWCDSMYAVEPKEIKANRRMMSMQEILGDIQNRPFAPYVTFTGGDPCLQKHLGDLIMPFNQQGIRVAVETQGQLFPDWLNSADVVTFSPKGPSSGNVVDTADLIEWCVKQGPRRNKQVCIKVVVFDEADFAYAMGLYNELPEWSYDAFYFTGGTPLDVNNMEDRVRGVLLGQFAVAHMLLTHVQHGARFNTKVHIGSQQHVLLWPDEDKGV